MPLQATSGAASYDAFGGGGAAVPQYIEDVFSTWLYTGTGASQTITNSIDLSTKGGLTWIKGRSGATGHRFTDTARGVTKSLESNSTAAEVTESTGLTAFGTTGFTIGADADYNTSAATYASWTFRKQPKFFDVVTYTGTGANRTISHSLGSVPACIMVKRTDTTADWQVYHRSLANTQYLVLNTTAAVATGATRWNSTTPTSTEFSLGTDTTVNASGGTYVAYIFAHNAGGFGLAGTDNVISCGTFTSTAGGGANVTLGFEPQWILFKRSNSSLTANWWIIDNTRGWSLSATATGSAPSFFAESSAAESALAASLNSTGFKVDASNLAGSAPHIYIAIRRGPMKVPTSGTSVFGLSARTGTGANATVTGSAGVTDLAIIKNRGTNALSVSASRLTGTGYVVTSSTAAEVAAAVSELQANPWDVMDGVKVGTTSAMTNASANTFINYLFKRAPSFMDVVCYTGTGSATTVTHNLTVMPELIFVKLRSTGQNWFAGTQFGATKYSGLSLNSTAASGGGAQNTDYTSATGSNFNYGMGAQPTSSTFTIDATTLTNSNGNTYIAYLFATCAGVSKVGSYTGTAATLQVDCGFSAGARFVLIKRTDSTGDWYVWDTARGIVSGNDPYLLLNDRAAEVTSTDYIDTSSAGFEISSTAPAAINASGGTFIFLAIA